MDPESEKQFEELQNMNIAIFNNKKYADVTFVITDDGSEIQAHQLILGVRSRVLDRMFDSGENRIEIAGCSNQIFAIFLLYLYAYILPDPKMDMEDAKILVDLGTKYGVRDLLDVMDAQLKTRITNKNAISLVTFGEKHNLLWVHANAFLLILKNFKKISMKPAFLTITRKMFLSILNSKLTQASEVEKLHAIIRWAHHRVTTKQLAPVAGNIVLESITLSRELDWTQITQREFLDKREQQLMKEKRDWVYIYNLLRR